ncbi:hypothetical protein N7463_000403 [Penicillium fimorum]|uniref:Uncharacterized protein n=1 Tax=Penicillium fimorum TaxID=1882269 RepID=A0A9W9Y480_9EURO|nr:hypothetical protein N7463_000403 [Penicillium fimorum]
MAKTGARGRLCTVTKLSTLILIAYDYLSDQVFNESYIARTSDGLPDFWRTDGGDALFLAPAEEEPLAPILRQLQHVSAPMRRLIIEESEAPITRRCRESGVSSTEISGLEGKQVLPRKREKQAVTAPRPGSS